MTCKVTYLSTGMDLHSQFDRFEGGEIELQYYVIVMARCTAVAGVEIWVFLGSTGALDVRYDVR